MRTNLSHHARRLAPLRLRPRARRLALALLVAAVPALSAPVPVAVAEPMVDFEVQRSDTLIWLSRDVLVRPAAWREVARLNRLPDPNRIQPGQVLRIPTRLMRVTALPAKLVGSFGDVRIGGKAAAPGNAASAVEGSPLAAVEGSLLAAVQGSLLAAVEGSLLAAVEGSLLAAVEGSLLAAGQTVQTGPASSAVIEFADGSQVRLPPSSLAEVLTSQTVGVRPAGAGLPAGGVVGGWFSGAMRVLRGSVEVFATKVLRARPLEVVTPTAVVGVRGTGFRVGFDEAARGRTRVEVLDGQVRLDGPGPAKGADVPKGFGSTADAVAPPLPPVRLLPPPDLSGMLALFERPIVRFSLPTEATSLRVQVAADEAFERIVVDQRVEPGGDVRIAGLEDGTWHLRSRRVDPNTLEGLDAKARFVLKARPEPPAYRTPRSDSKQAVGTVEFAWAPNIDAARVRLQIAEDAAFARLLQDRDALTDASLRTDITTPGVYFWRLASVRASGDAGPFGDAQRFELRPLPDPPKGGMSADGRSLIFAWGGRAEDRQQVQLASDPLFAQVVAESELSTPTWTLPTPDRSGRYFFRYRSVEPDGFISPYSSPMLIEVPRDWSELWLLLPLPLLLLLL